MKTAQFQPSRLTQARLLRVMTMTDLARRSGLTRQAISQFENGRTNPSAESLRTLAKELDQPARFFFLPCTVLESQVESPPTYRSLLTSANKERNQIGVQLGLLAATVDRLVGSHIELPDLRVPAFDVPDFMALDDDQIEDLAYRTREGMGLGNGPISNVCLLLEKHGVIVARKPVSSRVDAVTRWYGGRPLIIVSDRVSSVRARFNLAHELGHIVIHRSVADEEAGDPQIHRLMESQANQFAANFLLPEATFGSEVYRTDIRSLIELKKRWKVSVAAIIMRLASLGFVSDRQKRRLFSQLGNKQKEPLDDVIEHEIPQMLREALRFVKSEGLLPASVTDVLPMKATDLAEFLSVDPDSLTRESNVVDFGESRIRAI